MQGRAFKVYGEPKFEGAQPTHSGGMGYRASGLGTEQAAPARGPCIRGVHRRTPKIVGGVPIRRGGV